MTTAQAIQSIFKAFETEYKENLNLTEDEIVAVWRENDENIEKTVAALKPMNKPSSNNPPADEPSADEPSEGEIEAFQRMAEDAKALLSHERSGETKYVTLGNHAGDWFKAWLKRVGLAPEELTQNKAEDLRKDLKNKLEEAIDYKKRSDMGLDMSIASFENHVTRALRAGALLATGRIEFNAKARRFVASEKLAYHGLTLYHEVLDEKTGTMKREARALTDEPVLLTQSKLDTIYNLHMPRIVEAGATNTKEVTKKKRGRKRGSSVGANNGDENKTPTAAQETIRVLTDKTANEGATFELNYQDANEKSAYDRGKKLMNEGSAPLSAALILILTTSIETGQIKRWPESARKMSGELCELLMRADEIWSEEDRKNEEKSQKKAS